MSVDGKKILTTSMEVPDELVEIVAAVLEELTSAQEQYPPFNSPHEGWATIFEEDWELFDEVRKKKPIKVNMYHEAKQVAAMGIRFMLDIGK